MVIIAGYEVELRESFFNFNPGLDSRFTWRFKTDEYTGEDLYNIFYQKFELRLFHIVINSDHIVSKHLQDSLPEGILNSRQREYFAVGHFIPTNGCLNYHKYQHLHFRKNN